MQRVIGAIMRRFLLRPRVRRASWEQLFSAAYACHERLESTLAGVPDAAAEITPQGESSIRDQLAHLAAMDRAIAATLESLRLGRVPAGVGRDAIGAATDATWPEVRADYESSWKRLAQAAAAPIATGPTAEHDLFGALTAPEWLALAAWQHELHIRQMERVMKSKEYGKAQGAPW